MSSRPVSRFARVAGGRHQDSLLDQVFAQQLAQPLVVIDDEDVRLLLGQCHGVDYSAIAQTKVRIASTTW